MNKPGLFDVVELLIDLPEETLRAGARGAIVQCYADATYEVEFTNMDGETLAQLPLTPQQFIVVWHAETRTWAPVAEQLVEVLAHMPQEAERQVLDFARFLRAKQHEPG